MQNLFIIGVSCSTFGKFPHVGFKELAFQVTTQALADAGAGVEPRQPNIGSAWFSNCLANLWGQSMIRGQVALRRLFDEEVLDPGIPVTNVESACASGSKAFVGACHDVLTGVSEIALAVGIEKLCMPQGNEAAIAAMAEAYDTFDSQRWQEEHRRRAEAAGTAYRPSDDHAVTMDTYAVMANEHMARYGSTVEQIAAAAAKNHCHGARNPKAQYRFELTVDDVLADRLIMPPLTRAMCAPIGDGGAAAIVCGSATLRKLAPEVRSRAVRVRGVGQASGRFRAADEESVTSVAAKRAFAAARAAPSDIDVVELHDAASVAEIIELENLGLMKPGEAGPAVAAGVTAIGGDLPVNLSGGLVSKGHPVGATGLSMVYETVLQLRGEAGERQAMQPRLGLIENGGGITGMEAAACVVSILERVE